MKKTDFLIRKYLANRPLFHAFIRPQEGSLFFENSPLIKGKVLDYGCGDGFFAKIVFDKMRIDVGLDLKNSRAKTAEKEKTYQKIAYYDGLHIPFPDKHFQSIISNCVLEHITGLPLRLAEINRVLKPGGYFVTTVMTDKWEKYLLGGKIFGQTYRNFMRKVQDHHNLFSWEKWESLFKKSGFKLIKKVGYLSKSASNYNELFHFLSLPSLISYKLFGRWVICPKAFSQKIVAEEIKKTIAYPIDLNQSAAVFFVLKK